MFGVGRSGLLCCIDDRKARMQDIILFDGECAYCDRWVRWILKRDQHKRFRFVALKSGEGISLRKAHDVPDHIDSIVLLSDGRVHLRSCAAWRVLEALPGWRAAAIVLRIVPRPLRDLGYDLIARNRHRLKGEEACELP